MMKKLLVMVLVLGMASVANADLIFTVDGEPQPAEISIRPSDEITLDLHLADGENILKYQLMYELSNEQAEFILPDPETSPQYGISFPWLSTFPGKVNSYDTDGVISYVEIAADNFMMAAAGPLDLMDGLIIHCLDTTDVVLTITVSQATTINGQELTIGTVLHTLTIHQIPEPMTVALLGLGGLFLLRRRK
jgi:hypothetical protein